MRYPAIVVGLILVLAGVGSAPATDIYMWTDEDGQVHFGDIPGGQYPIRLAIESRPTDRARIQAIAQARTEAGIRAEEAKVAAALDGPSAEVLMAEAAERTRKCTVYKFNLETYLTNRRLYNTSPDGEREYLSEDEIAAAREVAAKQVTEFCS